MAVHCTLSTVLGKKRLRVQDVHVQTGLSRNTLTNMYYDRACRMDYGTLEKLCAFLKCEISDILSITEDTDEEKAK